MIIPHGLPSVKRSRGIGLPKQRRQISVAMQMVYEEVMAITTSETMALKPTIGPKLMSDMQQVKAMDTQTARRGTSKSWTCRTENISNPQCI